MNNYGWNSTIEQFLETDIDSILNNLCLNVYEQDYNDLLKNPKENSALPQIRAWIDCIQVLQQELAYFTNLEAQIILEYEIPRSGGKRPDVLIMLPGELIVLEFKSYARIHDAERNQTSLYVRDIQQYHSAVQNFNLKVRGALVVTAEEHLYEVDTQYQIRIVGCKNIHKLLEVVLKQSYTSHPIQVEKFLEGTYQPLPSILDSAKAIMKNEPLPQIKSLKSSNFYEVINEVKNITAFAKVNNTHHLVLVSGVPGAGKTFVGLTLAHDLESAVYLSGNRPLIDVLQDTLQNKSFVQHLYPYKQDYLKHQQTPKENIIIFDEAQRAWDKKQMKRDVSEPDVIIQIAQDKPWSVVIGLIGEGQEIHLGEEGGIDLWNTAIKNQGINVHAKHQQNVFPNALQYYENNKLHLNTSLRTHNALDYFQWVELYLAHDFKACKEIASHLQKERYTLKVMNSLEEAKEYVRKLYEGTDKTYGVVISSSIKKPTDIKVLPYGNRDYIVQPHAAYFNHMESPFYCKKLDYAATEFQVQGLELDMAIVYWGEDMKDVNGQWRFDSRYFKYGANDPEQMKLNAYRVLLTRGRDGTIIIN